MDMTAKDKEILEKTTLNSIVEDLDGIIHGDARSWVSEDGSYYVLVSGTGDAVGSCGGSGCWAYNPEVVEDWLDGLGDDRATYQDLCDSTDPVWNIDLAKELWDDRYALCIPGTCRPLMEDWGANLIQTATNLRGLHEALIEIEDFDDDLFDEIPIHQSDLPTFGGPKPEFTPNVWSWDRTHVLVGDGTWSECEIMPR